MSGRPHKYNRNEAIMHIMMRKSGCDRLMWDGTDIYTGPFERSDEWLPRIEKLDSEGWTYFTFHPEKRCNQVKGWPTEEEIQSEIDCSQALAEKYANHPNAMSVNDVIGVTEMLAGYKTTKKSK